MKAIYLNDIKAIFSEEEIKLDENMANHTSFKTGGNADVYIETASLEKIQKYLNLDIVREGKIPTYFIGNGTNILVTDKGVRGVVIRYYNNFYQINKEGNKAVIKVSSSVSLPYLSNVIVNHSLKGFEFASQIPGTIGGAIYMNAGAFLSEMKDIVKSVTYLDYEFNEIVTLNNEQCEFEYRKSIFQKLPKAFILECVIELETGNKEEIQSRIERFWNKRITTQPLEYPSCGSTFKRGEDYITAELIDKAGLKGYKIGGAEVSNKHAGFIINTGNATSKDILELIEYVKKEVYKKFGKKIEEEVRIIGL